MQFGKDCLEDSIGIVRIKVLVLPLLDSMAAQVELPSRFDPLSIQDASGTMQGTTVQDQNGAA